MYQKPKAELLPLNTELERTLKILKKVRFSEAVVMAEQRETQQNILVVAVDKPQEQRTVEDFWRPVIRDDYSAVKQPAIETNNFDLKPALITMV